MKLPSHKTNSRYSLSSFLNGIGLGDKALDAPKKMPDLRIAAKGKSSKIENKNLDVAVDTADHNFLL